MAINKTDLVVEDFFSKIAETQIEPIYFKLYQDYDEKFQQIFAYFHSNFNSLFSFFNYKNEHNKHYNADQSRELLYIIEELNDLRAVLAGSENEIYVNDEYLTQCAKGTAVCQGDGVVDTPASLIVMLDWNCHHVKKNQRKQ